MSADIPGTTLLDPAVIDDPYPFYSRLREEAPVWRVPGTDVCAVSSFALVAEATAWVEDFSSIMHNLLYMGEDGLPARLSLGDGMQAMAVSDPPVHTVHRAAVFPELMARKMAGFEPDVSAVAKQYLDLALQDGSIDFMAAVGNRVPIAMITKLIGFREADLTRLLGAAFDGTALVGGRLSLNELNSLLDKTLQTNIWITEQLASYGADSEDEILGTITRSVNAGVMSESDGVAILQNLLSAGGESTTSLLGNSVRLLAERPELQQQLREDPELVPIFVEEALRLESPFRFLMRHAPRATALGEVDIPAGTTVLLFWAAANRDEDEFESPDDIRLDRRPARHHLAFGRGIHHCVGAPLARLEAQVVLTELLERTLSFRLDADKAPRWFDSLQVRRHEYLPIAAEPR
jgi:cytochrome P450 family 144